MVTDYDPITDDFLLHHIHHPEGSLTTESFLIPPIDGTGKGKGHDNNKKHSIRPKSAPKHRRHSPSALEYPSNEEFSEEELRLPGDDDEGSSAVSDQDFKDKNHHHHSVVFAPDLESAPKDKKATSTKAATEKTANGDNAVDKVI